MAGEKSNFEILAEMMIKDAQDRIKDDPEYAEYLKKHDRKLYDSIMSDDLYE